MNKVQYQLSSIMVCQYYQDLYVCKHDVNMYVNMMWVMSRVDFIFILKHKIIIVTALEWIKLLILV